MSEAALIEELARALCAAHYLDGYYQTMSEDELANEWVDWMPEAQAILPIIRAREIAAGERVREAAIEAVSEGEVWSDTPFSASIRALDIPSILKDEA